MFLQRVHIVSIDLFDWFAYLSLFGFYIYKETVNTNSLRYRILEFCYMIAHKQTKKKRMYSNNNPFCGYEGNDYVFLIQYTADTVDDVLISSIFLA